MILCQWYLDPDSDRKWNSGFLELYFGFHKKNFPRFRNSDSLTDMGQHGDREYESDQLTSLCHKLKENYRKELKYTEGDSKGKEYREKIHVEILSHMPFIKLLFLNFERVGAHHNEIKSALIHALKSLIYISLKIRLPKNHY